MKLFIILMLVLGSVYTPIANAFCTKVRYRGKVECLIRDPGVVEGVAKRNELIKELNVVFSVLKTLNAEIKDDLGCVKDIKKSYDSMNACIDRLYVALSASEIARREIEKSRKRFDRVTIDHPFMEEFRKGFKQNEIGISDIVSNIRRSITRMENVRLEIAQLEFKNKGTEAFNQGYNRVYCSGLSAQAKALQAFRFKYQMSENVGDVFGMRAHLKNLKRKLSEVRAGYEFCQLQEDEGLQAASSTAERLDQSFKTIQVEKNVAKACAAAVKNNPELIDGCQRSLRSEYFLFSLHSALKSQGVVK